MHKEAAMRSSVRGTKEESLLKVKGSAGCSEDKRVQLRGSPEAATEVKAGPRGSGWGDEGARSTLARFSSWSPDFGLVLQRGHCAHRHEPFGRKETGCLDFGTGVGRA